MHFNLWFMYFCKRPVFHSKNFNSVKTRFWINLISYSICLLLIGLSYDNLGQCIFLPHSTLTITDRFIMCGYQQRFKCSICYVQHFQSSFCSFIKEVLLIRVWFSSEIRQYSAAQHIRWHAQYCQSYGLKCIFQWKSHSSMKHYRNKWTERRQKVLYIT